MTAPTTIHPAPGFWSLGKAALFALLVSVAIFVGASIPTAKTDQRGDLFDQYIPQADTDGTSFARGKLPYWNPYVGGGIDQISSPASVDFYPFTWLLGLMPVPAREGMGLLMLLHLFIAVLGFMRWMAKVGVSGLPSWIGAAAFGYGLIGEAWFPPTLYTLAWLPWILNALDSKRPAWAASLVLALVIGLQLLAGFAQFFYYAMILVGLYASVKCLWERTARHLVVLLAGVVLGTGLAGVQVILSQNFMQNTWRGLGRLEPSVVHYTKEDGGWTTSAGARLKVTVKHFARTAARTILNDSPRESRCLSHRAEPGYLGVLAPLCLLPVFWTRHRRHALFFGATGFVGLYLSLGFLGSPLPIYDWLTRVVPLFGTFRTPDRLMLWFILAVAVLASFGAAELLAPGERRRKMLRGLAFLAGLMVVAHAALLFASRAAGSWPLFFVWVVLLLAGLMMFFRADANAVALASTRGRWITVGLSLVVLVDIVASSRYVSRFLEFPRPIYDSIHHSHSNDLVYLTKDDVQNLSDTVGDDRIYIAAKYRPVMNTSALPRFRTLPFYAVGTKRQSLLDKKFTGSELAHFVFYNLDPRSHPRFFDWSSVRTLVTTQALDNAEAAGWELVRRLPTGVFKYHNARCVPRAALFDSYRAGTEEEALAEMLSLVRLGPGEMPLLEDEPSAAWKQARAQSSAPEYNRVVMSRDENEMVELIATNARPAILLLSDTWYPGWECRVDGKLQPSLRANYLYRAVELMPGQHRIEFRYSPVGLKKGLMISGVSAAIIFGGLALSAFRRKHPAP